MPTIRRQRPRDRLRRRRRRAAARHAPWGDVARPPRDFAAQLRACAKAFQLYLPDARGHGRTPLGSASGGIRHDRPRRRRRARSSTRSAWRRSTCSASRWAAMTALHVRRPAAPERLRTLVVAGITPDARAAGKRGRADCSTRTGSSATTRPGRAASGPSRAEPGRGAWRPLLPAIAADVADAAAPDARPSCTRDRRADAGRGRRPRSVRARSTRRASWPAPSPTAACSSCPTRPRGR